MPKYLSSALVNLRFITNYSFFNSVFLTIYKSFFPLAPWNVNLKKKKINI